eukprot:scaffold5393_cov376-Prasinococcus_capsulatus_cf.AAC.1
MSAKPGGATKGLARRALARHKYLRPKEILPGRYASPTGNLYPRSARGLVPRTVARRPRCDDVTGSQPGSDPPYQRHDWLDRIPILIPEHSLATVAVSISAPDPCSGCRALRVAPGGQARDKSDRVRAWLRRGEGAEALPAGSGPEESVSILV